MFREVPLGRASNRLGVYLDGMRLYAVLLGRHSWRALPPVSLSEKPLSAVQLCQSPQILADGLHQLQQQLHHYRGPVALNLTKSWIQTGVMSLPDSLERGRHHQAEVCRQHGVAVSDQDCLEMVPLAPDTRHSGKWLYRYAFLSRQLQSVLRVLFERHHCRLVHLDAAVYGRARYHWRQIPAFPGRYAELHVGCSADRVELGLFLHHRLLDWQSFRRTSEDILQSYLLGLPAVLQRFPGLKLVSLRCRPDYIDNEGAMNAPSLCWSLPDPNLSDAHLAAYGGALAL